MIKVGQAVTVYTIGKKRQKQMSGKVVYVNEKHFTVSNGRYRESFLFIDIRIGYIDVVLKKVA
ncbi:MAG: hypothetical protein JM58_09100 [Peptococcaceae bacterium BICA1-8]|nr:MAG: hypothetical protein JM58_09100 [Peptococcaceae bacterium BICA1-8]